MSDTGPAGSAVPAGRSRLPERPPLSQPRSTGSRASQQPALGLLGLLLVIPVAVALAVGAGGEGSIRVLAPLVTFSLPLVVMIGFWWEDWPGTRLRSSWSGWADTVLIIAGAIVLTAIGQTLSGRLDPAALFDPSPGPGHVPTFPATMPLAGLAFVLTLQITLVGEGWPLRRLHPLVAGPIAVAIAWAIAVVAYLTVVEIESPPGSDVIARDGPVPGAVLGATLVLIGAWQVLFFVVWRGWPFATVASRATRLTIGHVTVIGGGILSYLVLQELLGLTPARITALSGCFIAAGLLLGMLLEGWFGNLSPAVERVVLLPATFALAALLAISLQAIANRAMHLPPRTADDWVGHAALNALATATILHVAIGRRWPFPNPAE
ncbi:hypothetical protein E0H75_08890 [Kribbella capetownensis]|uniref:Uncharacterized protein n=1 Tax=Kribbella capetownensis TaxID=1572659 RepID=A0A4R0K3S9_9ACTN|nr:hypothetical protein [Kribbella capetownensis]TCC53777.1 hypothetical protein E0H75_08890 [Kribbella capetownensis]